MPSTSPLTISVVVPVFNGGEDFRKCLQSLAKLVPAPAEIIVVANGDTDGSSQLAEEFGARVVRLPCPVGPGQARNVGASMAEGDILFFVDADVTVIPDAVGRVAEIFNRNPDVVALLGSYDDQPGAKNFLSQYRNLFHHYVHQTASEEASTFWGACGAIYRRVFLASGGFDESYGRPSIEDVELGYRLRRAGKRIRLCKTLQVKHWKRWTVRSLLKSDFFDRALPWTELILQDRGLINDLNFRFASRLSVVSTFGLVGAAFAAPWHTGFLVVLILLVLLLLSLNMPLYHFFYRKRGLWFGLQAIPWHWLYYFYSGVALILGTALYLVQGGRASKGSIPSAVDGASCQQKEHQE